MSDPSGSLVWPGSGLAPSGPSLTVSSLLVASPGPSNRETFTKALNQYKPLIRPLFVGYFMEEMENC